jgi:type 2 lantibiotic biosynthesis protein LanM
MISDHPSATSLQESADWLQALTLAERLRLGASPAPCDPSVRQAAQRRFETWKTQPPFKGDCLFTRRLAVDGLEEEALVRLLGESPASLRERQTGSPAWLQTLINAYAAPPSPAPLHWQREDPPVFLRIAEPLAHAGLLRLRRAVRELAVSLEDPPFDAETAADLFLSKLAEDLRGMLIRVFVLELQIARLEGNLPGETPEERFQSFAAGLSRPEAGMALLRSYPVLARRLVERVDQWVNVSLELLQHLAADWEDLRRTFFPGASPGRLSEVKGGAGDPHCGGRTVMKLLFASGPRLIYKPKPLAGDTAFQDLLQWIGGHGFDPGFRRLGVLDRGDHGWVELVTAAPCRTPEEVRRFYQRQGGYLALLLLLEATDFHAENLIAAGEHPVLVDLETLFHPRIDTPDLAAADTCPGASFSDSVLRSGMLPARAWGDDEHGGVDLSGLGSAAGQTTKPFWGPVEAGTDQMRFERRAMRIPPVDNLPSLNGEPVLLPDQAGEIENGFRRMDRLLREKQDELLSASGPLAAFAGTPMRVVLRPTQGYGTLLLESFHPHVLSDGFEQARLFDRLWGACERRPWMERVIPAELRDLERGDVPLFTTRPGSRDLWTSGGERLEGFFASSGLERVARRLRRGSAEDLERQVWTVSASLAVIALESRRSERRLLPCGRSQEPASPPALLEAARAAGHRLATLAFRDPGHASWLIMEPVATGRWLFRAALPDLYQGLSGIALFLGYLAAATGEERFTLLAREALASQDWQIREQPDAISDVGGFNGWGGVIYSLAHLGSLWQDEELLVQAEALVPRLADRVASDENYDVIAGAAGGLLSLLALHRARPSEAALQAALRCGEHLLAGAQPMEVGCGWMAKIAGPRPVAGMSHGTAGIALALLRLSDLCGDERFRRAALAGLAWERSVYSPERRNWPDLRSGAEDLAVHGDGRHFICAWCHGAAGIGQARVAGLPCLDTAAVREEIAAATATTLDEPLRDNHSLCHGALGNLDFLLATAEATGDASLRERVYRLAGDVLESIRADGWLYGLTPGSEPLGLMVGLAGIGYGLLRLAAPEMIPSPLTLEPPAGGPVRAQVVRRPATLAENATNLSKE